MFQTDSEGVRQAINFNSEWLLARTASPPGGHGESEKSRRSKKKKEVEEEEEVGWFGDPSLLLRASSATAAEKKKYLPLFWDKGKIEKTVLTWKRSRGKKGSVIWRTLLKVWRYTILRREYCTKKQIQEFSFDFKREKAAQPPRNGLSRNGETITDLLLQSLFLYFDKCRSGKKTGWPATRIPGKKPTFKD